MNKKENKRDNRKRKERMKKKKSNETEERQDMNEKINNIINVKEEQKTIITELKEERNFIEWKRKIKTRRKKKN